MTRAEELAAIAAFEASRGVARVPAPSREEHVDRVFAQARAAMEVVRKPGGRGFHVRARIAAVSVERIYWAMRVSNL